MKKNFLRKLLRRSTEFGSFFIRTPCDVILRINGGNIVILLTADNTSLFLLKSVSIGFKLKMLLSENRDAGRNKVNF